MNLGMSVGLSNDWVQRLMGMDGHPDQTVPQGADTRKTLFAQRDSTSRTLVTHGPSCPANMSHPISCQVSQHSSSKNMSKWLTIQYFPSNALHSGT